MIRTITLIECDGCGEIIIGCQDGHTNREHNALTVARRHQWARINDPIDLKDYCPKCRVNYAK